MYLTTSFLLTAPKENCKEIIATFQEYGLNADIIGNIIKDPNLLRINNGTETSIEVLRF
jgi:selenophosphate synthetase-related protein